MSVSRSISVAASHPVSTYPLFESIFPVMVYEESTMVGASFVQMRLTATFHVAEVAPLWSTAR